MDRGRNLARELPDAVRMRAAAIGAVGKDWLSGLDALVMGLSLKWGFVPGKVLAGGSESLILEAAMNDGASRIVKLGLPGSCDCANEARILGMTDAQCYVQLFDHDAEANALLLERLGPTLDSEGRPADEEIGIICALMRDAWRPTVQPPGVMTGAEKAKWLIDFIEQRYASFPQSCERATVDRAIDFAKQRAAAFDPLDSVLVHGDAHQTNTLQARDGRYKFIDPDGVFAEPACDLATLMRSWNKDLLAGDALALGQLRCEILAGMSHVAIDSIWQWGFIERVSTGLILYQIGIIDEAKDTLAVADQWGRD